MRKNTILVWALVLLAGGGEQLKAVPLLENLSSGTASGSGSGDAADFPAYNQAIGQRFTVPSGGFTITSAGFRMQATEPGKSMTIKVYTDNGNGSSSLPSAVYTDADDDGVIYIDDVSSLSGISSGGLGPVTVTGLDISLPAGTYWVVMENDDSTSDSAFDWDFTNYPDFGGGSGAGYDVRNIISTDNGATWPDQFNGFPFMMKLAGASGDLFNNLDSNHMAQPADDGTNQEASTDLLAAQRFHVLSSSVTINEIGAYLKEVETGKSILVQVVGNNINGTSGDQFDDFPDLTNVLATIYNGTTAAAGMTTSYQQISFNSFTSFDLNSGLYWLVIRNVDAVSSSAFDIDYTYAFSLDGEGGSDDGSQLSYLRAISTDDGSSYTGNIPTDEEFFPFLVRVSSTTGDIIDNLSIAPKPGDGGSGAATEFGGEELRMAQKFQFNKSVQLSSLTLSLKTVESSANFAVKIYGTNTSTDSPEFTNLIATLTPGGGQSNSTISSSAFQDFTLTDLDLNLTASTYWLVIENVNATLASPVDWQKSSTDTGTGLAGVATFFTRNTTHDQDGVLNRRKEFNNEPFLYNMEGFEIATADQDLTVEVAPSGAGVISVAGRSNAETDTVTEPPGSEISIVAVNNSGWRFDNWTGTLIDNADSSNTSVILDFTKTVTANFVATSDVQVVANPVEGGSPTVGGSANPSPDPDEGAVLALVANPTPGFDFVNWTATDTTGINDVNSASTTYTVQSADTVITANYQPSGTPGYSAWRQSDSSGIKNETINIGPDDDFDSGGFNNLNEYAFFKNAANSGDDNTPYGTGTAIDGSALDFQVLLTLPKDPDITFTIRSGSSPTALNNISLLTYDSGTETWSIDDTDSGMSLDSSATNSSDANYSDIVISRDTALSTPYFVEITVSIN